MVILLQELVAVGRDQALLALASLGGCHSIPEIGQGKRDLSHQKLHLVPLWGHGGETSPDLGLGAQSPICQTPLQQHCRCPGVPRAVGTSQKLNPAIGWEGVLAAWPVCHQFESILEAKSPLSLSWLCLFGIDPILKGKADEPD